MRKNERKPTSGISLLEIVIAFTLLMIVIAPFLKTFSTTNRAVKKGGDYTTALYICQKIIEDIRYNLYNEDSTDFSEFLAAAGEQGTTVVPGTDCSRYFLNLFDPENEVDQAIIGQMAKYSVEINHGGYCVPLDASDEERAEKATIDVDGDGKKDPDVTIITVTVKWKDTTQAGDGNDREVRFSTVVSKAQNERREDISRTP